MIGEDPCRGDGVRWNLGRAGLPRFGGAARLVEAGQLRPNVARAFALAEAGEAHRFLSTQPAGKVVLVS
jgi:NADPH:quinone reductase-like Zn-dependent oxidoreductase